VRAIDRVVGKDGNRSRLIEAAVVEYLERRQRARREARDLEILNRHAARLNREVADVLDFQADLQGDYSAEEAEP
jgi:metal-responsive CopG/Arc/MetJ family transcriptional regulator